MKESLVKLVEVSIRVISMLDVPSFELHPLGDGAYVSIMTRQIKKPLDIVLAAKGFEVGFYAMNDMIEIRIYESLD